MHTPNDPSFEPPLYHRLLIHIAALLVPRAARPSWRFRQDQRLYHWWVLNQRGEITASQAQTAALLRGAFDDALHHRILPGNLANALRGPLFYLAAAATLTALLAVLTRGFAYTRHLLSLAAQLLPGPPDLRSDVLVGHAFILAISFAAGLTMIFIRRPPSHSGGLRYWTFFILQCALALTLVPLAWIESAAALRSCFPHHEGMRALGTLLLTLAYLPSLAAVLAWVLSDQRARCPVCLRRLEFPVSLGSWASVFDPSSTELLCDRGHGALVLADTTNGLEHWTRLDRSWSSLFSQSGV